MSGIFITLDLRPTGEMMLLGDALIQALNRLAAAMETKADPAQSEADGRTIPGRAEVATRLPSGAPSLGRPAADDRMFSPERNAIIRRDYPIGVSIDAIMVQCHALPGREIPRNRISIQAGKLGVGRPSDAPYVRVASPEATRSPVTKAAEPQPKIDLSGLRTLGNVVERKSPAATPSQTPTKQQAPQPQSRMEAIAAVSHIQRAVVDPGEPIAVDFDQVRQWAAQRGITFSSWDDLPAVNRKRDALGIATFKRRFAMMGVRT